MLELVGLTLEIGGLRILDELSLRVEASETLGLIGPNGAGKTTALNLVSGLVAPTAGRVLLDGRDITGQPPEQISRAGVARTFQSLRLFGGMSVLENVLAGGYTHAHARPWQVALRTPAFRREETRLRAEAAALLDLFGPRLSGFRHDQLAGSLSYANRRRLEIARALMSRPRLLLLDEPAAGMNPHETAELAELIAAIRGRFALTILLIEHDMGLVERLCDRVIALDHGQKLAEGDYASVAADPNVVGAYLGDGALTHK
jgi:branched-chain amino acid transport system ATP-binding protein